ncbi:MAG: SDR family NAD(P)-dependent oxidoreductase [Saprospiraceae bacterium]|nr:SDR family NAD(P)-dependent oxidoreductase [Saprospiraceae bacterium]
MKILITGASRGIGAFLLNSFYNDGYQVFGTYCSTPPTSDKMFLFTKVDISEQQEIKDWIETCVRKDDKIVLINCAGINYNAIARKADVNKWKQLIDVNLIGTFALINALLPLMHENGFGRIINCSSVLAQKGVAGTSAYAASKSALNGLVKCLAVENAAQGITINNLCLGYFNIGMTQNDVPEIVREKIKKQIPSHTFGDPQNIYLAIKFLIEADYVNGTSIDINGGLI